jgi:hypothetical protein
VMMHIIVGHVKHHWQTLRDKMYWINKDSGEICWYNPFTYEISTLKREELGIK